jgi:hypothetical protein
VGRGEVPVRRRCGKPKEGATSAPAGAWSLLGGGLRHISEEKSCQMCKGGLMTVRRRHGGGGGVVPLCRRHGTCKEGAW